MEISETSKTKGKRTICFLGVMHSIYDSRVYHKMIRTCKKRYKIIEIAEGEKEDIIYENNVIIYSLTKKRGRITYLRRFIKISFSLQADLFIANDIESYFIALILKVFRRKKIVFDSHEFYESHLWTKQPWFYYIYLLVFLVCRVLCTWIFDGVITVTDFMASQYKRYNKNVISIYNMPSIEIFKDIKPKLDERFEDKIILLYQGGIDHTRHFLFYFRIINVLKKEIPNIFLLAIGWGSFDDEILDYIKKNHLEKYYEWIERVPFTELLSYTKLAKIGLICLKHSFNNDNSFPNKMLEYAGCCLPSIGSKNVKHFGKVIERNNAGISVNPENTYEGVRAVKKILKNYEIFQRNTKHVIEKYHWEKQEEKLFIFLKKLF